jgi:hypothetical protein
MNDIYTGLIPLKFNLIYVGGNKFNHLKLSSFLILTH